MSSQPRLEFEQTVALSLQGYSLRSSTDADRAFERCLFESARSDAMLLAAWPDRVRRPFLDQQFHFQTTHYARAHPSADWLLVVKDDDAIGRMILDRAEEEWCLVDIALLPPWRGKGIGSKLLLSVLADAARMHARVRLTVDANNRAQRLYARLGFAIDNDGFPNVGMVWRPAPLS